MPFRAQPSRACRAGSIPGEPARCSKRPRLGRSVRLAAALAARGPRVMTSWGSRTSALTNAADVFESKPNRASAPRTSTTKSAGMTAVSAPLNIREWRRLRQRSWFPRVAAPQLRPRPVASSRAGHGRDPLARTRKRSGAISKSGRSETFPLPSRHRALLRGSALGKRNGYDGRSRLAMPKNEDPLRTVLSGVNELAKVRFGMNREAFFMWSMMTTLRAKL